jgi:hypothetical protein
MRNKIVIVQRDEDGIAVLDTPKKRLLFVFWFIVCIVFITISYITPVWFVYWVLTGKSLLKEVFETEEI